MLEYAEIPAKEAVTTLVNLCNRVVLLMLCGGKERALPSLIVLFENIAFAHSARFHRPKVHVMGRFFEAY